MAAATTIALIGLAVSAAGAVGQAVSAQQAAKASRRAERLREQQMRLDAMKRRRESIRQAILASSLGRARQTAQGVDSGSSVTGGAFGQVSGELGRQLNYTNQSETIGTGIFRANADLATAQGNASMFNGLGQFGGSLFANAQQISNIGTTLFGSSTPVIGGGPSIPATSNPWSPATVIPSAAVTVPMGSQYAPQASYAPHGY